MYNDETPPDSSENFSRPAFVPRRQKIDLVVTPLTTSPATTTIIKTSPITKTITSSSSPAKDGGAAGPQFLRIVTENENNIVNGNDNNDDVQQEQQQQREQQNRSTTTPPSKSVVKNIKYSSFSLDLTSTSSSSRV